MSAIQKELIEVTEVKLGRNGDRQKFLNDLVTAVAALSDKDWDSLGKASQKWYNAAADVRNAKASDPLPDFPDYVAEEAKEETTTRRRRAEPEVAEPKEGDRVTVVSKRGKTYKGELVELTDKLIAVKADDGEVDEINTDGATITVDGAEADGGDEPQGYEPKEGDTVTLTNKRGKVVTGKIVEIKGDMIAIDDGKDDHEFTMDRVESIVPAGGAKEEAKSGRRATKEDTADKGGKDAKADEATSRSRSTNEGVSIGTRIKELIADNIDASEADIGKALKKEGLEYKDNTLKLNYSDAHKFIAILKKAKLLK